MGDRAAHRQQHPAAAIDDDALSPTGSLPEPACVLGEYIGRTYAEVKARPRYITEQTIMSKEMEQIIISEDAPSEV